MEFIGKNPNGLNSVSQSVIVLTVDGIDQLSVSTSSLNLNTSLSVRNSITASIISGSQFTGSFSGSFVGDGRGLTNITQIASGSTIVNVTPQGIFANNNTQITGSLNVSSSISSSLFRGDGSGLFNISADAIGDINRLRSGSAVAQISPNQGLQINVNTQISGGLGVTGSQYISQNIVVGGDSRISGNETILGNLAVGGRITATELFTTFITSSVIFASGSTKFGDASNDKHEFTGSLALSGSLNLSGSISIQSGSLPDTDSQVVLVYNNTTGRVGFKFAAASSGTSGTSGTSGSSGSSGSS